MLPSVSPTVGHCDGREGRGRSASSPDGTAGRTLGGLGHSFVQAISFCPLKEAHGVRKSRQADKHWRY